MLQRPWRLLAAIVVAVLVLFAAYAAWLLLVTEKELSRASDDGHALKSAIADTDKAGVRRSLARLQKDADAAEKHTSGVTWQVLRHLPFVGDDFTGVRVVSQVASDLSHSNLAQVATQTNDLKSILPSGGRIDLAEVRRLAPSVAEGHAAVAKAVAQLDKENSGGFVGPLRRKYRDLQAQIDEAGSMLGVADTAFHVMPAMLGADGPRHYLLVMQNNAEIRATGGLPGAVSELDATNGKVTMTNETSGGSFGQNPHPLPLTASEKALYGVQMGEYFLDANFTPDFPRAAELMRTRWNQENPGRIDGVITVDPVTLSYLLRATGPIEVDGIQLTADNVVDQLLHDTYMRIADPKLQDLFFHDAAIAIFDRILNGLPNPRDLVSALHQGAVEHRVLIHSFDRSVQTRFAGTTIAGEVPRKAGDHPQVGVYFNDSTGAKMSYYLRYQAAMDATSCSHGVQTLSGSLSIGSTAPADAASLPTYITGGDSFDVPPGNQVVSVMLFGPLGGFMDRVQLNGADATQQQWFQLDGRPVIKLWAALAPGKTDKITWTMRTGAGQTGSTQLGVTPSIVAGNSSATVKSACS